ncbi:CDP-diacylglycerol--glycerol-3-phosphate 3-phosphatidyltransferase [Pirellulaceae bacterium SH501]
MSDRAASQSPSNWNVPNALSGLRLLLSFGVFYLIESGGFLAAMICFLVAASTDWIDGWWARRFNQVTKLGRILDPFVDKIIICGAMIAIAAIPGSPLRPWMATLVVGRELLVTSLRAMVEGSGGDFSAKQLGKWKMVLQCAAVAMVLFQFHQGEVSSVYRIATQVVVYLAMALTVVSGIEYVLLVVRKPRG